MAEEAALGPYKQKRGKDGGGEGAQEGRETRRLLASAQSGTELPPTHF